MQATRQINRGKEGDMSHLARFVGKWATRSSISCLFPIRPVLQTQPNTNQVMEPKRVRS